MGVSSPSGEEGKTTAFPYSCILMPSPLPVGIRRHLPTPWSKLGPASGVEWPPMLICEYFQVALRTCQDLACP